MVRTERLNRVGQSGHRGLHSLQAILSDMSVSTVRTRAVVEGAVARTRSGACSFLGRSTDATVARQAVQLLDVRQRLPPSRPHVRHLFCENSDPRSPAWYTWPAVSPFSSEVHVPPLPPSRTRPWRGPRSMFVPCAGTLFVTKRT